MGSRRKGREAALQILYQVDVSGVPAKRAMSLFWRHLKPDAPGDEEFAATLVKGYADSIEKIDELITQASHHWRLERMGIVDRSILRLGTVELLDTEIPRRVTLNESVELAKRFGSEGSSAFVNGILDTIATNLNKE